MDVAQEVTWAPSAQAPKIIPDVSQTSKPTATFLAVSIGSDGSAQN